MSLAKKFSLVLILVFCVSFVKSQQYFPEEPKAFDIKLLKKKVVYIPIVDKVPRGLKEVNAFKEFKTDKQIDAEWERRWKEGIEQSVYDITDFQVLRFNMEELKKERDKVAIILNFEKDFYDNWTAYLVVTEPKYAVIASAPANGLELTKVEDISLLFNMLTYSMINASNYYGDDAKPLYKGHENEYKKALDAFSDNLKDKLLLVPKYSSKEVKKYKKVNDKTEAFLKEEWKLTAYEMLKTQELEEKLKEEGFDGYYLRPFDIYTDNPNITYKYFMVMCANNDVILFDIKGQRELRYSNLKYLQPKLEEWLYYFMDAKKRRIIDKAREQAAQKKEASKGKSSSSKATSGKKGETDSKNPARATKSK